MPTTYTDNSVGKTGLAIPDRYTDEIWTPWSDNAYIINRMLGGYLAIAQGDANYTLLDTSVARESRTLALKFTTTLTAAREIKIDTTTSAKYSGRLFVIWNASAGAFKLTIKTTAGGSTGPDVNQGKIRAVWHDGTNVYPVGPELDATTFAIALSSLPSTPKCRAYHNANQSLATATVLALALNSERWDNDTIHDTSTNNSRLTCKTAGHYGMIGQAFFDASAVGQRELLIRLNGATYIAAESRPAVAVASNGTGVIISTEYDLAVNDYVELIAFQDSGVSLNILAGGNYTPEFMMVRLGS